MASLTFSLYVFSAFSSLGKKFDGRRGRRPSRWGSTGSLLAGALPPVASSWAGLGSSGSPAVGAEGRVTL